MEKNHDQQGIKVISHVHKLGFGHCIITFITLLVCCKQNDDHVLSNGRKQVCRGEKKCIHESDKVKVGKEKRERKCCYTKKGASGIVWCCVKEENDVNG